MNRHGPTPGPLQPNGTAPTIKTLRRMHLRVVGVAGRTVKSTANHQCNRGAAILIWPADADLPVEGGLETDYEEGVGTQLQHRFHRGIRVSVYFDCSTRVRLIGLYYF